MALLLTRVSAPFRHSETHAMKWQANGELAGSDLHALLTRLHLVETEERARELQQCLGRRAQQS